MTENPIFKNKNKIILWVIIGSLFISAIFLSYFIFKPFFWSGITAGIFYIATRKIFKNLVDFLGPKFQWTAPWIMVFILLTAIALPTSFIVSNLIRETLNLIQFIRFSLTEEKIISTILKFSYITDIFTENEFFWLKIPLLYREWIGKYIDILNLDSFYGILRNSSTTILGSLNLPTGLFFNTFFSFLFLFFLYKEGKKLEKTILYVLPFPKELEDKIGRRIEAAVQTIVMGNILIGLLQGAVIYLIVLIAGFSNPFLYAVIGFFFSFIPVIGTAVVWLPLGAYLLLFQQTWVKALIFMIVAFSAYLILENLVKPKLLDKKLKIHPFLIFLSLIGGISEFGLIGVIIGPIALTSIIIIWDFWKLLRENDLHPEDNSNA